MYIIPQESRPGASRARLILLRVTHRHFAYAATRPAPLTLLLRLWSRPHRRFLASTHAVRDFPERPASVEYRAFRPASTRRIITASFAIQVTVYTADGLVKTYLYIRPPRRTRHR